MRNIFVIVLTFITSITYSQTVYKQKLDTKRNSRNVIWDKIDLDYLPKNFISKIGFLPKKLNSGQQTIEFNFITKNGDKFLNLKSIILKASSNETIDINNPIRDSTYYLSDGSLSWYIIYNLDQSEVDIIKKEIIKEIIINANNQTLKIRLARKSQNLFRDNF